MLSHRIHKIGAFHSPSHQGDKKERLANIIRQILT